MIKIKPLGNKVLIKRSKAETQKGKILLPDSAQEKPKMGEVVAVGPGETNEEGKTTKMHVEVGNRVLFSSYSGTEVEEDLMILSEKDILGILS